MVRCRSTAALQAALHLDAAWRAGPHAATIQMLFTDIRLRSHTLLAELCSQVVGIVRDLAREAPLRSLAVTGGHNLRSQSKNLSQVTLDISPA